MDRWWCDATKSGQSASVNVFGFHMIGLFWMRPKDPSLYLFGPCYIKLVPNINYLCPLNKAPCGDRIGNRSVITQSMCQVLSYKRDLIVLSTWTFSYVVYNHLGTDNLRNTLTCSTRKEWLGFCLLVLLNLDFTQPF